MKKSIIHAYIPPGLICNNQLAGQGKIVQISNDRQYKTVWKTNVKCQIKLKMQQCKQFCRYRKQLQQLCSRRKSQPCLYITLLIISGSQLHLDCINQKPNTPCGFEQNKQKLLPTLHVLKRQRRNAQVKQNILISQIN